MKVREGNPFRKFRLAEGLSQKEMAEACNVSRHAIIRLEQGTYASPLPSVLDYVTKNSDHSHSYLITEYDNFQKAVRSESGLILGNIPLLVNSLDARGQHPLTYLRKRAGLNQTELAKALCISQTVINHFETKYVNQHQVPRQLLDALKDAGYFYRALADLQIAYTRFRDGYIERNQVRLVDAVAL